MYWKRICYITQQLLYHSPLEAFAFLIRDIGKLAETYPGAPEISKMKNFATIVDGFYP